jgi:hypothetical protein
LTAIEPLRSRRRTEHGLQLGPLSISFQRFQRPPDGIVLQIPPSLGALPAGQDGGGEWLLPVADGEAFWIGVNAERATELAVKADRQKGEALDALSGRPWAAQTAQTVAVEQFVVIAGLRHRDALWAFARTAADPTAPTCRAISFFERDASLSQLAIVRLVDYADFAERTGLAPPAPIDANAGYKGYRLP